MSFSDRRRNGDEGWWVKGKVHSLRGNCAKDIHWNSSVLQSPTDSTGKRHGSVLRLLSDVNTYKIMTLMVQFTSTSQSSHAYLDVSEWAVSFCGGTGDNASSIICAARSGRTISIGDWRTRLDEGRDPSYCTSTADAPRPLRSMLYSETYTQHILNMSN